MSALSHACVSTSGYTAPMKTGVAAEEEFEGFFLPFGKQAKVYRFEDAKALYGKNKRKVANDAKPSDYIVTFKGITFFAEVKSSENPTSFPFGMLQPGQSAIGAAVTIAGGEYWIFAKSDVLDQWFRIPYRVVMDTRAAGKKSIKWDELGPYRWSGPC
jgi:penicillin-binding protein-related factor A (putative recombinase)